MRTTRLWVSTTILATALAFGLTATLTAQPAGATAKCKDGTYSTAKTKQGACSGHGGIETWLADESKSAAKETKEDTAAAGKATKEAAKGVGKTTKEGAKATAGATKEGASAAKDATKTTSKPSNAPADATAKCKDGSYSHAKQHRGACSGHGGVAEWYK